MASSVSVGHWLGRSVGPSWVAAGENALQGLGETDDPLLMNVPAADARRAVERATGRNLQYLVLEDMRDLETLADAVRVWWGSKSRAQAVLVFMNSSGGSFTMNDAVGAEILAGQVIKALPGGERGYIEMGLFVWQTLVDEANVRTRPAVMSAGMGNALPWLLGAGAVVGIGYLILKRR